MTAKPHLSYQEQIEVLAGRGLAFSDYELFLKVLRTVGYYRFSAYTYPLRVIAKGKDSSTVTRSEQFRPGASFEDALALYEFDKKLRDLMSEGLEMVEIGLGAQIGHVLGRRDALAHLDKKFLDLSRCNAPDKPSKPHGLTSFEAWVEKFYFLRGRASAEDYVVHHELKYGGRIPIWVCVEFLDFGALTRIYRLLNRWDRLEIAKRFGIVDDFAGLFEDWLDSLNVLRNQCAHHDRLWNRVHLNPRKPNLASVSSSLLHISDLRAIDLTRLYPLVAILGYLTRAQDGESAWLCNAQKLFSSFETSIGITPENSMGFPDGWQELELWEPVRKSK